MNDELAIFPLNTVLFPDGRLDLRIFEQRYVDMTRECLRDDKEFGVCLILDGQEAGQPAVPHRLGCAARIEQCDVPAPGLFQLQCRGTRVFELQNSQIMADGLRRGEVRWREEVPDLELPAEHQPLKLLFNQALGTLGQDVFLKPHRPDLSAWLVHRLAEVSVTSRAARQQLLETGDPEQKLALLNRQLEAERAAR